MAGAAASLARDQLDLVGEWAIALREAMRSYRRAITRSCGDGSLEPGRLAIVQGGCVKRLWPYALLLALAAGFFWPLARAPDGFLYPPNSDFSDLTITHWPNALFIRHSLATWGQVPLWRPLILGGEPFASNPLSGLWYPPNLLLLVFPLTLAFNLLFVLHATWAGCGAYQLARSIGASHAGSLLAAFTVMFAPKSVAHLAAGHVGLYYAWAWLPWLLWAVRRLARRGNTHDVVLAAVVAAMLILADVRLGFYGALAAGGYWIVNLRPQISILRLRIAAAGGAVLLAGALVAVQMVPLVAVAGRLNRGRLSLEDSGVFSLPPRCLAGLLVADRGGFQEWMTYLGVVGLVLAAVGLVRWKSQERWWWGGLALCAAIYSLGVYTPLYGLLYRVLPLLGWLRVPPRAWFLVVLAAAALAARGMTALEEWKSKRLWMDRVAVGCAGAALAGIAVGLIKGLSVSIVAGVLVWSLAVALAALSIGGRLSAPLSTGLILALALADFGLVDSTLYRVRSANEVLAEGEAAAAWLAEQPGRFRVYSPSYSIPHHVGAVYGIESADGMDPFQLADYVTFMRDATGVDLPGYSVTVPSFPEVDKMQDILLAHRDVVPDLRLLGLLNVRYIAAAYPMEAEGLALLNQWGEVYLYRNEEALLRAFVEEDYGGVREARVAEWTPNRIQVEAEGPGLLVLSEVYDTDWRVEIDGEAAEMMHVEGILRGVRLHEGVHRVTFAYRPKGLTAGLILTGAGWLCAAALWTRLGSPGRKAAVSHGMHGEWVRG
jgi:hypothetical protein